MWGNRRVSFSRKEEIQRALNHIDSSPLSSIRGNITRTNSPVRNISGEHYSLKSSKRTIEINPPVKKKSPPVVLSIDTYVNVERHLRNCFVDFVSGLLRINPLERWSPQQARAHPFITEVDWTGPYIAASE